MSSQEARQGEEGRRYRTCPLYTAATGLPYLRGANPLQGDDLTAHITRSLPALPSGYEAEKPRAIEEEEKEFSAFRTLRDSRAAQRNEGQRQKRAAAKAAEEAQKKQ